MANGGGVGCVQLQRLVAGYAFEVVVTQLDADGFALVAFALQVGGHLLAQAGENLPQLLAVAHRVQVFLKGGFAAHADGFAVHAHRALVAAPGGFVQPSAVDLAKVGHQLQAVACGQIADGVDAVFLQFLLGLGANAVDLAASQRPDQGLQIGFVHDRNPIGFVELAGHFGDQFVRRHAHRAGQARGFKNGFLDQAGQHPSAVALAARHIGEVDVDLVHTAVFHQRGDVGDDGFEAARIVPVLVKIHRQQNRFGAQLGGFHQAHGRADAEFARRVGGGGDHAATGVTSDAREKIQRNVRQVLRAPFLRRVSLR